MSTSVAVAARRLHDLDNLRNGAVLLLIVFHTARLFDAEPWHIKHAQTYAVADLVVRALNLWQMPLLFLLAGIAATQALARRSPAGFLRERAARLLLPLAAGIPLWVLPQVYVERIAHGAPGRASPIDFDGGLAAFLPHFAECCYPAANFSYHHLWFLLYLFAYSLCLPPLAMRFRRRATEDGAGTPPPGLPALLAFGALPIAAEGLLRARFPSTHAFIDDWANHAHYFGLVVIGAWLGGMPNAFDGAARRWKPLLAAAVALAGVWLFAPPPQGAAPWFRGATEWIWLLALLGGGRRWLDRPLPGLGGFTRLALPFYCAHQTFIVLLGWAWLGWRDDPWAKALAIGALATLASLAVARLGERHPITRRILGMKAPRRV